MANVNTIPVVVTPSRSQLCLPGNVVTDSNGNPVLNPDGSYKTSGIEILDPGPASAQAKTIPPKIQVPKSFLISFANPTPPGGIGRLSQLQTKATMTMLGQALSGFSYNLFSASNQLGKYQLSADTLHNLGYIKFSYLNKYGSKAVKYNDAWTGLNGIVDANTWLLSAGVQENTMYKLMANNYEYMANAQIIKSADNLCTRAGMVCVAHILGIEGARTWRTTAAGTDAVGNTGSYFFALGRYAVDVLSYLTI